MIVALVTGTVLGGAYSSAGLFAPRWTKTGEPLKYPDDKYLVGVGGPAESRDAADDEAKAKLAEQIRVQVESEVVSYLQESVHKSGPNVSDKLVQEVTWQVKSKVDITLEGLEYADRYYDSVNKEYYTLAILDRKHAGKTRMDKAEELRESGRSYYNKAMTCVHKGDYGSAVINLNKAHSFLTEATAREREAKVIGGVQVRVIPAELTPWELQLKKSSMLRKARIGLYLIEQNPLDPGSEIVTSVVSGRLNRQGLSIGSAQHFLGDMDYKSLSTLSIDQLSGMLGKNLSFLVFGEIEAKESSRLKLHSSTVHFYKCRASIKALNIHTGEVISHVAFDWEEETKVGKTRAVEAATGSLKEAGRLISQRLDRDFEEYLYGEEGRE